VFFIFIPCKIPVKNTAMPNRLKWDKMARPLLPASAKRPGAVSLGHLRWRYNVKRHPPWGIFPLRIFIWPQFLQHLLTKKYVVDKMNRIL
jgi:hypothetical protein